MPRVATILGLSLLMLLAGSVPAQNWEFPREPVARKFDSFGRLGHCDLTARLDNFAIMLQSTPNAEATIVYYGPEGTGPGASGNVFENIKGYLSNTRGLDLGMVKTIYGGRNSDLKQPEIELWIVPKGVAPPEPEKKENDIETFQGMFDEHTRGDDFGLYFEPEMGPGIGNTTAASFADMLQQQQKNAVGYVVVYSGENLTPGGWRQLAESEIDYLKSFNLDSSRLKMIFGGYRKETKLQWWILPKKAPPPVAEAKELPLAKTIKVDDFAEWALSYERNQKTIVTRLADILRLEKTARAFLVVRIAPPVVEETPAEIQEATPVIEEAPGESMPQPEPLDFTKLVEKWRVELTTTYKIAPERLIILFTTAAEYDSKISLWIVPKGQPLPDPKEEEEEEPEPEP